MENRRKLENLKVEEVFLNGVSILKDKLLEIKNLKTFIQNSEIIRDLSLYVEEGEIVCIVGRNGAGKTTLFNTIVGLLSAKEGEIRFKGKDIKTLSPNQISKLGVGFMPDELRIFSNLTVEENILLPLKSGIGSKEMMNFIYSVFPVLKEYKKRLGPQLSGGEKKMLAIARTLTLDPDLLMIDEPFEGLAPSLKKELEEALNELREKGISLFLSESNLENMPEMTNRLYVIERGEIIYSGDPEKSFEDERVRRIFNL